jgi:hypothetical protein
VEMEVLFQKQYSTDYSFLEILLKGFYKIHSTAKSFHVERYGNEKENRQFWIPVKWT